MLSLESLFVIAIPSLPEFELSGSGTFWGMATTASICHAACKERDDDNFDCFASIGAISVVLQSLGLSQRCK